MNSCLFSILQNDVIMVRNLLSIAAFSGKGHASDRFSFGEKVINTKKTGAEINFARFSEISTDVLEDLTSYQTFIFLACI